jgi:aspartate 1-decarboxylase
MHRLMLKSKLHRVRVTAADLHYEGSLSLDPALMRAADILPFEQVAVANVANGSRFETYAIEGEPGEVKLNGAAARLGAPGDLLIVMTYAQATEEEAAGWHPVVVHVDVANRILGRPAAVS